MQTRPVCLTEVFISPASLLERHERLHKHLPSSPYTYGAIYSPIDLAPSPTQHEVIGEPSLHLSGLLLLEDDLQWRLGGDSERANSPPWTWASEELCGHPRPYYARDLSLVSSLTVAGPRPHYPAPYIARLTFSGTAAFDYLHTLQLHEIPGWLSQDCYDCSKAAQTPPIRGALRYVSIHSFDTTVRLESAAALLADGMRMMEIHKPYLKWDMRVYELEGSAAHHKVPADMPLISQHDPKPSVLSKQTPFETSLLQSQRAGSTPSCPSPLRASVTPTPDTPTPTMRTIERSALR